MEEEKTSKIQGKASAKPDTSKKSQKQADTFQSTIGRRANHGPSGKQIVAMTDEKKVAPKKLGKEGIHVKKIEDNKVSIFNQNIDNSK